MSQTAVLTTDADGLALWVNAAHTKLSGYTLDEMIGKKPEAFYKVQKLILILLHISAIN